MIFRTMDCHDKGIMYGGVTDDGRDISTNSIYLFQLSHNTIVSYCIYISSKRGYPQ